MFSERYSRQINLIGEVNQLKLSNARVLVIGAGAIGSPVLLYLAAGGIGKVGFIDHDIVTESNLHRQILYTEHDEGKAKSSAALLKLKSINSEIDLVEHNSKLTLENASTIFSDYDLIIDGSDNFKTRYLVNDNCCQLDIPFISSSIFQNTIQIIFFDIKQGCYRCAFPEPPPPFLMNNCSDAGVLGPTAGIAGSITASLVINYFIKPEAIEPLRIISFNSDTFNTKRFPFSQNEQCLACHHKSISWPSLNFNVNIQDIELANYKIVDIRELSEDRHIKLTQNEYHIPFSEMLELPSHIPQGQLLLYCHSGTRSDYAAYFLRKNGFQAFSLENGVYSR